MAAKGGNGWTEKKELIEALNAGKQALLKQEDYFNAAIIRDHVASIEKNERKMK